MTASIDSIQAGRSLAKTGKRTLLVVDDDEGPRKSLHLVFHNDYEVLLASSGSEALDLAAHHPIDAAILDIRMVGMTGIELLERLKKFDPAIEVVMLTGFETVETVRQALRLGACDYLSKPFDIQTIRAAVANAIERRTLSQEIKSSNEQLAFLQSELQTQLVQQEISRGKGEIYASILHDINGPLTIIAGYIQLIDQTVGSAQKLERPDIEVLKGHLKLIIRQVTHCVEISHRYLGFLRQKSSTRGSVSVNKALDDLRQLLKGHPSRKGHQLEIVPLRGEASVEVNGADLIQILLNLTINGFQSTPEPHFVKIRSQLIDRSLDFTQIKESSSDRLLNPENMKGHPPLVLFMVEDSGPGISPENLEKIFQPFFSTKADKGTGLGLSIVQRLTKEARGVLHVHSELGKGTAFHLYLPAVGGTVSRSLQ